MSGAGKTSRAGGRVWGSPCVATMSRAGEPWCGEKNFFFLRVSDGGIKAKYLPKIKTGFTWKERRKKKSKIEQIREQRQRHGWEENRG